MRRSSSLLSRSQLLRDTSPGITYGEHEGGDGEAFRRAACRHGLEGIVEEEPTAAFCTATAACRSRASVSTAPSSSSSTGPILKDRDTQWAHSYSAVGKWVEIGSCALSHPSRRGSRQDAMDDLLRRLDHCVLFDDAILDLANEFVAVLYKL